MDGPFSCSFVWYFVVLLNCIIRESTKISPKVAICTFGRAVSSLVRMLFEVKETNGLI